jgi:hypothetical protein
METTLLPENIIIKLVTSLTMNRLQVYSEFFLLEDKQTLMTILPFHKEPTNYIIISSSQNNIEFYSIQYTTTLISSSILTIIQKINITTIRGNVKINIRGTSFDVPMKIPSIYNSATVKESILNLFNFPSLSFALHSATILHFTHFDNFYYLTYIGNIDDDFKKIESVVYWDYANHTLIGKVKDTVYYVFNSSFFEYCNQYGSIYDNGKIILGGIFNYLIDEKSENVKSITYAFPLSFQTDEINGDRIKFCAFQSFIPIENTIYYFIAIANCNSNNLNNYAIFSKSTFRKSKGTIQTFPVLIQFVSEKDDTFQNINTFYFKYTQEIVKIYSIGYQEFLDVNINNVEISNITTYKKDFQEYYNVLTNSIEKKNEIIENEDVVVNTNENVIQEDMTEYFYKDYKKY